MQYGQSYNSKRKEIQHKGSDTDEPRHREKLVVARKPVSEGWILYASSYVELCEIWFRRRKVEQLQARAWRKERQAFWLKQVWCCGFARMKGISKMDSRDGYCVWMYVTALEWDMSDAEIYMLYLFYMTFKIKNSLG